MNGALDLSGITAIDKIRNDYLLHLAADSDLPLIK